VSSQDDDYQTTLLSDVDDSGSDEGPRQGSLGFGLLILRLALGVTMGAHGLQHLFGLFGGPGIGGFTHLLETYGYHKQLTLLAWITGVTEIAGSVLVIVGLFTPLAAAGLLGIAANVVFAKFHHGFFGGQGFELEFMLGAASLGLIFTGAGPASLERNTPWRKRPLPLALTSLLISAAASVVVIVLTR
jgi:putative oxidoreductase